MKLGSARVEPGIAVPSVAHDDGAAHSPSVGAPADPATAAIAASGSQSLGSDGVVLPSPAVLDPVLADAAARAGVPSTEVRVVSSIERQWADGSMGCPRPGLRYTQALVDGYQIIVRAGDEELDYRVRGPGRFRVCEAP